jgi:squalene-hopene/tetraprenyl-beta-curcumene cyclase
VIADFVLKLLDKQPIKPFRKIAMKKVETWVVNHQEMDGSWGGIMLPWIYSLMVLKAMGYGSNHAVIKKGLEGLKPFLVEDDQTMRMQPSTSPVWDTAWATLALVESGLPPDHPALVKSGKWLLKEQILTKGDWKIKNPQTEAGCWAFEFDNEFYPDIDDTSVVARALHDIKFTKDEKPVKSEAVSRGWSWVTQMQCKNGGWAAFDRDNNKQILADVPFADFMSPLDPTSADVTAHAIELAGKLGQQTDCVKRGIKYLKEVQEPDGPWYGRWGVNYIYGTGLVLAALKAAGENMAQKYIYHAVDWLTSHRMRTAGGERPVEHILVRNQGQGTSSSLKPPGR